jgi:hypothetical protein
MLLFLKFVDFYGKNNHECEGKEFCRSNCNNTYFFISLETLEALILIRCKFTKWYKIVINLPVKDIYVTPRAGVTKRPKVQDLRSF